jgi:hypothetical protein
MQGSAVDGNERFRRARTQLVDQARHQFLSRPAFPWMRTVARLAATRPRGL